MAGRKKSNREEALEQLALIEELKNRVKFNKIKHYEPYPYQKEFISGAVKESARLLMAGNRVGKSDVGGFETACHLTGQYPAWWTGRRYDRPTHGLAAGVTELSTRDVVMQKLMGTVHNPDDIGTGFLPKDCIIKTVNKVGGAKNALDAVMVKHVSGGQSVLTFRSYQAGFEKLMGLSLDFCWLDEEPPYDYYSQCLARVLDKQGMIYITATPEKGKSAIIAKFMDDSRPQHMGLYRAGWNDVSAKVGGHLNESAMAELKAAFSPHEFKMRSEGLPVFGSGMIYTTPREQLEVNSFPIPEHWWKISAIDFGVNHGTAGVWLAHDRDTDTYYLFDCMKIKDSNSIIIADAFKKKSNRIPIAWPRDGLQREKGSGSSLTEIYRGHDMPLLWEPATNPGGNTIYVEPGLMAINELMATGRFKVFSHLEGFFKEYGSYHRKEDGSISKIDDDILDAVRYAWMMIGRHGVQGPMHGDQYDGIKDINELIDTSWVY